MKLQKIFTISLMVLLVLGLFSVFIPKINAQIIVTRYTGNPIISAPPGYEDVKDPSVIHATDGNYYCAFSECNGATWNIGLSYTSSLTGTWSFIGTILTKTQTWETTFGNNGVDAPDLIQVGSTIYCFYCSDVGGGSSAIGYASIPISSIMTYTGWTKYANNPIVEPSSGQWDAHYTYDPDVVHVDDSYYLFYAGSSSGSGTGSGNPQGSQIGLAIISIVNFPNTGGWTKYSSSAPVYSYGSAQEAPDVQYINGNWFMLTALNPNTLLSVSTDCLSWNYQSTLLSGSGGSNWDSKDCISTSMLLDSGNVYIFYCSHNTGYYQIGYISTPLSSWTVGLTLNFNISALGGGIGGQIGYAFNGGSFIESSTQNFIYGTYIAVVVNPISGYSIVNITVTDLDNGNSQINEGTTDFQFQVTYDANITAYLTSSGSLSKIITFNIVGSGSVSYSSAYFSTPISVTNGESIAFSLNTPLALQTSPNSGWLDANITFHDTDNGSYWYELPSLTISQTYGFSVLSNGVLTIYFKQPSNNIFPSLPSFLGNLKNDATITIFAVCLIGFMWFFKFTGVIVGIGIATILCAVMNLIPFYIVALVILLEITLIVLGGDLLHIGGQKPQVTG